MGEVAGRGESLYYAMKLLHDLGGVLVADDIADFPWHPDYGGRGHIKGTLHHGLVGYLLQELSVLGGLVALLLMMQEEE